LLKMKILQLIASINPSDGGTAETLVQTSAACRRLGHEVEIACLDHPQAPWVVDNPIKVHAFNSTRHACWLPKKLIPWVRYGYSAQLVSWLKAHRGRYDAVIVHGLWNYAALGARLALPGSGTPYFVYTHGMLDPWFRKTYPAKNIAKQLLWLFSEGPLLNGAAGVIFTADEERCRAKNSFWPYRLQERVCDLGTADPPAASQQQIEAMHSAIPQLRGRRFLLFLGRLHPQKGTDLLIRAFARKARHHSDLDLVIAGPDQIGWQAALEAIACEEKLTDRIVWTGEVRGDVKWGLLRAAEALILPSHHENFGIVVAEAMACERIVLISDKVNIWREVKASGGGIVASDDLAGTEMLIESFLALSSREREVAGASGRRYFLKNFEITWTISKLLHAVEGLQ
jgi:glycosyltransferase involved in cell wall biosynthesis